MDEWKRPSVQQEQMWFLHRIEPQGSTYHLAFALELWGDLDARASHRALSDVVAAQDGLRATLPSTPDGRVRLQERPPGEVALARFDVGSPAEAEALLTNNVEAPIDLEGGPLFRFVLIRMSEKHHILGCTFHHAVFDGASVELFIHAWAKAYEGALKAPRGELRETLSDGDAPRALMSPAAPFSDFVRRQREGDPKARNRKALAYWKNQLSNLETLELPADMPAAQRSARLGSTYRHQLPHPLRTRVEDFAREQGATPFMVLLTAFSTVVGRHAGTTDVPLGTPISLRMEPQLRERIGMLVNTVVLRCRGDGDPTFEEYVQRVKRTCISAYRYHSVPFPEVVEAVAPERAFGRNPLFSAMFILQTAPRLPTLPGLKIGHRELCTKTSKFDLTGSAVMTQDGWELVLEYDSGLFVEASIARLGQRFETLLSAAVEGPQVPISKLALLSSSEIDLVRDWSGTDQLLSGEDPPSILEVFDAEVRRAPDRVVMVSGDGRTTTVGELAEAEQALRAGLASNGVLPGDLVALALDPGVDLLASALAVLRLGAAYVPVDPHVPAARQALIIEDSNPRCIVVADQDAQPGGPLYSQLAVSLPHLRMRRGRVSEAADRSTAPALNELAYVIYTSGSTGRPKGVEITHRSLSRFLMAFREGVELPPRARWATLATFSFDISVLELYYPLLFDGTAVVVPRSVAQDARALAEWIDEGKVDILQATPTRHRMLVSAGMRGHPGLVVLSGGESLTVELARALLLRSSRLINVYGPTEGTVWSTVHEVDREKLEALAPQNQLPIGRTIPGVRAYVLDKRGALSPVGVPGELFLTGRQLGRGYLNRSELTQRSFLALSSVGPGRGYLTGDRVRFRWDGELEFLGRSDDQVKIRGHRIELGEVQAQLRTLPGVLEAAVVARTGPGDAMALYGFVVLQGSHRTSGIDLRREMLTRVPEPFVPTAITVLDALPKTPSGKLDRKALPAPQSLAARSADDGPPLDALEREIATAWSKTLRVPFVGRNDDFFDLGGQSIVAVELAAQIEKATGQPVPVVDILRFRTVAGLAERIRFGRPKIEFYHDLPRTVVELKSGGPGPVVFFIHDGLGDTVPYLNLAKRLPADVRVYGLEPDRRDGLATVHTRIEDMARFHVTQMQIIQPQGPYIIGGLCAGGLLAFEVARQLARTGRSVAFVGILEAVAPETTPVFAYENRKRFKRLASLFSAFPKQPTQTITEFFRKLVRGATWEARMLIYRTIQQTRYTAAQVFENREPFLRGMDFFSIYDLAARHYTPEPLHADIPVTLVRATRSVREDLEPFGPPRRSVWYEDDSPRRDLVVDKDLGWKKYLPRGFRIVDVEAGHSSMLQEEVPSQEIADLFAGACGLVRRTALTQPIASNAVEVVAPHETPVAVE